MKEFETPSHPWDAETVYALGLYRLIGHGLGIWPLKCHDFGSKFRFFTVLFLQLLLNCCLIREIVSDCGVFVLDTISYIAANTIGILKILAIRVNKKKMYCLVESAVEDWSTVRNGKSREVMRKHARIGRYVGILQLGSAYATVVPAALVALPVFEQVTNSTSQATNFSSLTMRQLPMSSGCFIVDSPLFFYLFVYIFELMEYVIVGSSYIGIDAIFFGVSMHLCAQIEILKIDIARLGQHFNDKDMREEFNGLIQRQNHLARLVNFIEDVFHLVILAQLTASALNICQMGFSILFVSKTHEYMEAANSLVIMIVLGLQLFLYSYVGDYLASQMEELRDAAYNCCWYNFPRSLQKNVIFVIMRCNDSFNLTAGKVYCMNIMNFTGIVKTIVSFFSVAKLIVTD